MTSALTVRGLKELETSYRRAADAMARAEARAVNRVATTIVARQSREIVKIANLKVGPVKRSIELKKKATADLPRLVFEVHAKPISLIEYGGRGSWKGATALVLRQGGRKKVKGGFLTKSPQGAPQIWKRTGEPKRLAKKGRYSKGRLAKQLREPIKKLWGPSILSQYIKPEVLQIGNDAWTERLPIELARETAFALKQAGL